MAYGGYQRAICTDCDGTGKCSQCGGTGQHLTGPCVMCHGTGQCQTCEGTGFPPSYSLSDVLPDWLARLWNRIRVQKPAP